jgi:hypothetical protein
MAYGLQYYGYIKPIGETTSYKFEIEVEGYSGGSSLISALGLKPQHEKNRASRSDSKKILKGAEMRLEVISLPSDSDKYLPLFEKQYKDVRITFYRSTTKIWQGYLQPDNYSKTFIDEAGRYKIIFSATNAIGDLKKIPFNDSDGYAYQDRVSILTVLKRAIEKTGIEMPFKVQLNTWETTLMTSSQCALEKGKVNCKRFIKYKDGREIQDNCLKVVEEILRPFNVSMFMAEGAYWIVNNTETNSNVYEYDYATLTLQNTTSTNRVVNLSSYDYHGYGDEEKMKPYKKIELAFRDRNLGENLLGDPGFDTGTSDWNKGSGLTTMGRQLVNSNYAMEASINTTTTPSGERVFYSDVHSLDWKAEGDKVKLTFRIKPETLSFATPGIPDHYKAVKATFTVHKVSYNGTVIPVSGSTNSFTLMDGEDWSSKEIYWDLSEDANYVVKCTIDPAADLLLSDYDDLGILVDDFFFSVVYASSDVTYDRMYILENTANEFVEIAEREIFFGDSLQANDVGAYWVGTSKTSGWRRQGDSTDAQIQNLYLKNELRRRGSYKDFAEATIHDPAQNIKPYSALLINSKTYNIVGYNRDTRLGTLKVHLEELLTTDPTSTLSFQSLSSVDGKSTSGSLEVVSSPTVIDDTTIRTDGVWSSFKVNDELADKADSTDLHSHSNKSTLDNLTQSVIDNSHTHSNKTTLDGISTSDINNWNSAWGDSHNHANKTTLDGIDSADVAIWDAAASVWTPKGFDFYSDTQIGIGDFSSQAIDFPLHVLNPTSSIIGFFDGTGSGLDAGLRILADPTKQAILQFGDSANVNAGRINYDNTNHRMQFYTNDLHAVTIEDNGNVGIGITLPTEALHVYDTSGVLGLFDGTGSSGNGVIRVLAPTAGDAGIQFGDSVDVNYGRVMYDNSAHDLMFYTQNTKRATIDSSGLNVTAQIVAGTRVRINTSATTYPLEVNGTVNATDYRATSDRRLKKRIKDISGLKAVKILSALDAKSFIWKASGQSAFGYIAQDVKVNELVSVSKEGWYGMNYPAVVPILSEGWKVHQKRLNKLTRKIEKLEAKLRKRI